MADYRRPTREIASQAASDYDHGWRCWEMPDGAGFRLRAHVDDVEKSMTKQIDGVATESRLEIAAINKRGWYQAGGIAAVVAIGLVVLGALITAQVKSASDNSVKRADIEQAIRRSADMATAKHDDDLMLLQRAYEKAMAQVPANQPQTNKAWRK